MNKISLTLVTVFVGISLIFTFLQMEKPDFEVKSKFIVVPQNSIVANDMDNIINNIVNIAREQQSNETVQRKRAMVEVERVNKSSMFQVTTLAQTDKEANEINEQVIYNITKDIAKYYNVETDIKINRINGGESEKNFFSGILPMVFWALVGILICILVVMIIELIIPQKEEKKMVDLRNVIANKSESSDVNNSVAVTPVTGSAPVYNLKDSVNTNYEFNSFQTRESFQENSVSKEESEKQSEIVVEEKQEVVKEKKEEVKKEIEETKDDSNVTKAVEVKEKPVVKKVVETSPSVVTNSSTSRSGAPSNLPVVEFNAEASQGTLVEDSVEQSESGSDEPTEEELKARLNKLLKGEM